MNFQGGLLVEPLLIKKWHCFYPGCTEFLYQKHSHQKYCTFHRKVRIKEHWQRQNRERIKNIRCSKKAPLLYLLKTNKMVSRYEMLAFAEIKKESMLTIHLWRLRKDGHIIKKRKGMYYYEGKN